MFPSLHGAERRDSLQESVAYNPIGSYGVIGNMHTAALVAMDGSIDWLCYPRFDSPSVFARLLDEHKGGFFKIAPLEPGADLKQFYLPDTNVLVTRFLTVDGVGEITDFMPLGFHSGVHRNLVVRDVLCARGVMKFRMECRPAFDYARTPHKVELVAHGARFQTPAMGLSLTSSTPMVLDGAAATAEFVLQEGQRAVFVLSHREPSAACAALIETGEGYDMLRATVDYWHRWISRCTYHGRWREIVQRSALTLKLMTYEPTGAILAAVTASLPERLGGPRNWDYRYTWIRDSAFTVYALLRIGMKEEAARFMEWIEKRCHELKPGIPLQIMYGIDGRQKLDETVLDHLDGYMGSRPVRIGNGAYGQLQLDIYGELMDAVYLYNKYGAPVSSELWGHLRYLTNWVCDEWRKPDAGIWEGRGGPRQFVYSKLMCWVAVDRSLRLADKRSFPAERERWLRVRDEIYEEIMAKGWSEERQSFSRSFGGDELDASALMMPLVFFMAPNDPRMLKTLDAIRTPTSRGGLLSDSLLYRYDHARGDVPLGAEGTFNMCSFWLVEALTRAGAADPARLSDARLTFEKMLCYANHLGLYGEQTGPRGEAMGNYPQAFTHLALISAAFNLDRALGPGK
jgi:GH15 family glucan-1,4-alpha-glucosidase